MEKCTPRLRLRVVYLSSIRECARSIDRSISFVPPIEIARDPACGIVTSATLRRVTQHRQQKLTAALLVKISRFLLFFFTQPRGYATVSFKLPEQGRASSLASSPWLRPLLRLRFRFIALISEARHIKLARIALISAASSCAENVQLT